jgi:hypothetical protein
LTYEQAKKMKKAMLVHVHQQAMKLSSPSRKSKADLLSDLFPAECEELQAPTSSKRKRGVVAPQVTEEQIRGPQGNSHRVYDTLAMPVSNYDPMHSDRYMYIVHISVKPTHYYTDELTSTQHSK